MFGGFFMVPLTPSPNNNRQRMIPLSQHTSVRANQLLHIKHDRSKELPL